MRFQTLNPSRAARSVALAAAIALTAPAALAHHVGDGSVALDQQVLAATNQLLAALSQWEALPPSLKESTLANLVQLAQSRQQALLALVKADPAVAATRLLPKPIRVRMPAAVGAFVETEVRAQGNGFIHVADNFARKTSTATFRILGPEGREPTEVYLAEVDHRKRSLDRLAGKKLSFDGMRIGDLLLVLDRRSVVSQSLQAAGGTGTSVSTAEAATTTVQGDQRTLSILLNFTDRPLSCTPTDVANRLFGSSGSTVNNIYRDSSRGMVGFSGNAVGPVTIGYSSSGSCDYLGWANAAEAAARAAGIDPSQYTRVNYVTPINASCGWTGLAYMPGRQSWVQACTATGVFSHELGHNLALHHAATPTQEYGDNSDPMGGAMPVGHNGANRVMAGWQPSGTVTDVASSGSFGIATLSNSSLTGTAQVLRLPKPDTGEQYYVSMRQQIGFDAVLEWTFANTISIHRATGSLPTKTYLMQVLNPGQSFTDAANGITISHQGVSGGVANVGVSLGGALCSRQPPTVSVTPSSQTMPAGSSLNYSVTVQNNNSAACGASSFNLAQVLPAGLNGTLSASSLAISPGTVGTASWSVASLVTASTATLNIDATATDAGAAGSSATGHASVTVYGAAAPTTVSFSSPTGGSTLNGGKAVAIGVQVNTPQAYVEIYLDGNLLARDSSAPYSVNWNTRKAARGNHVLRARAVDASGRAVENSINVTLN